jgi:NADH:ubiquinone oxidoreductase subunit K
VVMEAVVEGWTVVVSTMILLAIEDVSEIVLMRFLRASSSLTYSKCEILYVFVVHVIAYGNEDNIAILYELFRR